KPGSVNDVVEMVRFARRNAIKVAARGQGHSTQGQSQVEAGVVIDMSTLAAVREINAADALVDGGARWLDLLQQTIPHGLTPPTPRLYESFYNDLHAFLSDLETLIDDGRFDTVQGFAVPDGSGGWLYQLETTKYFAPGGEPDDTALLAGLSFITGTQTAQDMP